MQTKPKPRDRTGFFLAFALLASITVPLPAGVAKAMDEVRHAIGWDTLDLKTIETDRAGRPTLETHNNETNKVERKTRYHDNGKKADESVLVTTPDSGKLLYAGKKSWSEDGTLTYLYAEDGSFSPGGRQIKGSIDEKKFDGNGRMTAETKKAFSSRSQSWSQVYGQDLEYYYGGDLMSRVTDDKGSGEKTRESWSATVGVTGRKQSTQKWNAATDAWD
jgi:hypothetical protein